MPLEWRSHFVETFFGYEGSQANNRSATHESAPSVGIENEADHSGIEAQAIIIPSDGLAWMEDVWMTVLRPMMRKVSIIPIQPQWFDLLEIMHAAYPQSTELEGRSSLVESSGHTESEEASEEAPHDAAPPLKLVEKRLEDSARGTLSALAVLLEAGADSMPRSLLDRVRQSCLLSDERLDHDVDSLCRIEAVLRRNRDS